MDPSKRGEGSGRSQAPRLSRPALLRDRLIERLVDRWAVPLTVVEAGAGFGKTTLVAQAVAENELDPRGLDRWLTCRPHDKVAATFAAAIMEALGGPSLYGGAVAESAARIVDAMRASAPTHVCLVLDDVHVLGSSGPAVQLLDDILDSLPGNGHVLLAGRADVPVSLARRRAAGVVNDVTERDLAFTDDEVRAFAAMRVATPGSIAAAGGWPALAELLATANRAVAVSYLWDEVLDHYDPERRRALAMLHALGGADGELLSAALCRSVDVWELTRSLPLATVTDGGWATVHELWAPALSRVLADEERRTGCLRAADVARRRREYTQAIRLYAAVGAFEDVLDLVRLVCSDSHPLVPTEVLNDWSREFVVAGKGETAEMALLVGAVRKPADPLGSVPFFELAGQRFAARGDVDGEVAAMFHLGHIAWWHEDYDRLARLFDRCVELAASGSELAASIVTLGPLVLGEVLGDADAVISAARSDSREHQHPEIAPLTDFLEARAHQIAGDPRSAIVPATRACDAATPTMRPPAEFERLSSLWAIGRADEVIPRIEPAIAELEEVAWLHNRAANGAQAALWLCLAGEPVRARAMLDRATQVSDSAGAWARALVALAEATLAVDCGDETAAAAIMRAELAVRPLDDPSVARAHRAWVPLSYVLFPEARAHWDVVPLRGTVASGRAAARALVARRERDEVDVSELPGVDLRAVRAQVPLPWLAELAAIIGSVGQQADAEDLLDGVRHALVRSRLRALSKHRQKSLANAASALLASHSVAPEQMVRAGVLGPLELSFNGTSRWPVQFNRRAVRDLLLLLIERGSLSRTRIGMILWPDLEDDAARNNLRVTLTYLTQALQPDRQANERSHFIEDVGDDIRLRPGAALQLDIVEFHSALEQAAAFERRGAMSLAQREYRRAVELYRGDYLESAAAAEWAYAPRERERLAFVKAAVRAGELALAGGDAAASTDLALRAIDVDRWCEPARRLLADARLAGGDRSGALRALEECARMLADLGVGPEPVTRMLARRIGFDRLS
jgi:LuxR family maltose regulon positive regulatory protein